MLTLLLTILAQSAPPCPPEMTLIECQLCQELYINQDIPYDECPCWDDTWSPIAEAGEGTGEVGYCCTPVGCIEDLICFEECMALNEDAVFLGEESCWDYGCANYADVGCCVGGECMIVNSALCVSSGGYVLPSPDCSAGCPAGNTAGEGQCCFLDLTMTPICLMLDQGDCDTAFLNYGFWDIDGDCDDDPCPEFPDDLCPDVTDIGACCIADACYEDIPFAVCDSVGSEYAQYGTCSDLPDCDGATVEYGACCIGDTCTDNVAQAVCLSGGGTFYVGQTCDGVDCDDFEPPDPPDDLEMACCWEDDTCDDDILITTCIAAQGRPKYGNCADITCDPPSSKLCECILLDKLVSLNTAILQELLDQGISLDQANEWLASINNGVENIEEHVFSLILITSVIRDNTTNIEQALNDLVNELTSGPTNSGYSGTGVNSSVHLANIQQSGDDVSNNFAGTIPSFPENPFDDDGSLGDAPVVEIDIPAITLGSYTADLPVMEWDLQMLSDWGVVQLLRTIIVFVTTLWCGNKLYEELRRYG